MEVDLPFAEAERRLLECPDDWIPGLAREAQNRGEDLLAHVGFGPEHLRVTRDVRITLGTPVEFPSKTVLPISWRAVNRESLFPSLEGDIEVASLGPERSQLAISARYRPPMGVIGNVMDKALLHRVAEATVKDFLDRAAGRIARIPT